MLPARVRSAAVPIDAFASRLPRFFVIYEQRGALGLEHFGGKLRKPEPKILKIDLFQVFVESSYGARKPVSAGDLFAQAKDLELRRECLAKTRQMGPFSAIHPLVSNEQGTADLAADGDRKKIQGVGFRAFIL